MLCDKQGLQNYYYPALFTKVVETPNIYFTITLEILHWQMKIEKKCFPKLTSPLNEFVSYHTHLKEHWLQACLYFHTNMFHTEKTSKSIS